MHANAILSGMPASYISYHPVSTVGAVQGAKLGPGVYGAGVYGAKLPAKSLAPRQC